MVFIGLDLQGGGDGGGEGCLKGKGSAAKPDPPIPACQ